MALSNTERKQLRARAHTLKPVILVGDAGLSQAVLDETDRTLEHHELIKVRLPAADREIRADLARTLCERLDAELVQAIGRAVVIFRPAGETAAPAGKQRSSGRK